MSSYNTLHPAIERESPDKIKQYQENLLQKQIRYTASRSAFYQRVFTKEKIDIEQIKTIEDLQHIPLTTKDDLNKFNQDFICVEKHKIVDYITTSGTLGDPVTFVMTDNDLDRLAYNEALSFVCSGCDNQDIMQLTTTIDKRFMAGLAYFLGARKLGAGIVIG